jgi:hypothetical protein
MRTAGQPHTAARPAAHSRSHCLTLPQCHTLPHTAAHTATQCCTLPRILPHTAARVRQCTAVCGSVSGSVSGSVRGSVWQCVAVRQYEAVRAAVCGRARGSVRLSSSAHGIDVQRSGSAAVCVSVVVCIFSNQFKINSYKFA